MNFTVLRFLSSMVVLIIVSCFLIATEWPRAQPHLVFCDVGQGDAILMIDGFSQVLVDTGRDDQVLSCLEKLLPFWDTHLELVVLTHPDSDHLGGMEAVLARYQPRYILTDLSGKQTDQYKAVFEAFKRSVEKGADIVLPRVGQKWRVGNIELDVWQISSVQERLAQTTETLLWDAILSGKSAHEGENNDSIVLFGLLQGASFLLTGDLEKEGELALSSYPLTTKNQLLKAGHHGSKTSSIPLFIQKVQPEKVVISSGKNNRYGHPAPEVLTTLRESGAEILRTDEHGNLDFVVRDTNWVVNETLFERLWNTFLLKGLFSNFVTQQTDWQVGKHSTHK